MKNKMGFTLAEILIAVLIVGVLTAMAVPWYKKAIEKSKITSALSILQAVSKSEHTWYLVNNRYTNDFADLDIHLIDKDGNKVEQDSFDNINYTFTLQDDNIKAERNNNEYTIYKFYEEPNIYCLPRDHYICQQFAWDVNQKLCKDIEASWSTTKHKCYNNDQERCDALNLDYLEEGKCGYTNTTNKTIGEETYCIGNIGGGCSGLTVENGGVCQGDIITACRNIKVNRGGSCIATGLGHHGACSRSTYTAAGCTAEAQDGCSYSEFNQGSTCWAKGGAENYAYWNFMCANSVYNGSKCVADSTGGTNACYNSTFTTGGICEATTPTACQSITVYEGSKCIAKRSGTCTGNYLGGCCEDYGKNFCPSYAKKC